MTDHLPPGFFTGGRIWGAPKTQSVSEILKRVAVCLGFWEKDAEAAIGSPPEGDIVRTAQVQGRDQNDHKESV
jgi:hypothetical protein